MKKIILSIYFLFPLFLFAQETRVLNGRYNDSQSFGKPIPDTVRTLIAGSNVTITSGGTSLVDTISATGGSGTPAGSTGYIQYNNAGSFGASSNLFWDNTNNRLGIGGVPSFDFQIQTNTNGASRLDLRNTNTGTAAQGLLEVSNGTAAFQVGVAGTGYTTNGLTTANTVFFQSNVGSRLVFRAITAAGKPLVPIIFGVGDGNTEAMRIFGNGSVSINTAGADSSAFLVVGAGTTSLAQVRLVGGVAPTSPLDGQIWYQSTNNRLMFRQNTTSVELMGTSSINTVSPTSPDRTLTVVINGTTYYIPAKTTND